MASINSSTVLLDKYRLLVEKFPRATFATLPTPVEPLNTKWDGIKSLNIKRDDLCGVSYGGNKIRKLEFIIGKAISKKAKKVLTYGYAGSNHATATAVCSSKFGMRSISMLLPQPRSQYVRDNLLMSYANGAELHLYKGARSLMVGTLSQFIRHRLQDGIAPHVIPAGGSSPLGNIGFLNAAFELKEQIDGGQLPEPDFIYLPLGTMGTAVGLIIGLKLLQMKTKLMCIRVVPERYASTRKFYSLFNKTVSFIRSVESSFPDIKLNAEDFAVVDEFFGKGYGVFTDAGRAVLDDMKKNYNIKLDGTYTSKAMAALIADASNGVLHNSDVLFWNTYNSRDFSASIEAINYHSLPHEFYPYFEQKLEQEYS